MSAVYTIQATFGKGEITPLAYGRVDADFFRQSCEKCRNFAVMLHGGVRRRSGTRYIAPVADETQISRLFPFSFNNEQSYVLDINAGGDIQFLAQRGYLGAPYTVSHPWDATEIDLLKYTQFNDLAYFAERDHRPQLLSRFGDTSWTLTDAVTNDGPYMSVNQGTTTLTLSDTGSAVPLMTSNNAPANYVASSSGGTANAYIVFARNEAATVTLDTGTVGWVKIDLGSGNPRVVDAYWIQGQPTNDGDAPTAWVIEGSNNDSTWFILDRVEGEVGWVQSERRYFEFSNETAFRYYRLRFSGGGGSDDTNTDLSQWVLHWAGDYQSPITLTASATAGINNGSGFQASDVGRVIRLRGTDGRWRWARIASRSSTTVVSVRLYGHAMPDVSPISEWALGAFSEQSGWPALVELYDERLNFGSTDTQPVTVWGSKQGAFGEFGAGATVLPTDGYSLTFLTSSMNELVWLAADEDLVVGSAKQLRSLAPADTTQAFSATNLTQRKGPSSGADQIQPLSIGGTLLYVAAGAKKIRELVLGDQNRYVAPEASIIGEHTLESGIKWWVFSENPEPTIYAGTESGDIVSILYDREQRAIGFGVFDIGGIAEAGTIIPSQVPGFDDLYLVVRRTINGATRRYIEVLEHPFQYDSNVTIVDGRPTAVDGFFVDCGLTYAGSPATVISGLGHLEGETLSGLLDGSVVEGLVVSGGAVTLPYPASVAHLGLPYESYLRTHRYSGPGQDGYLFGRQVNATSVFVDLLSTGALEVGAFDETDMRTFEVNPHYSDAFTGNPVQLVSGIVPCDIEGSWLTGAARVVLRTSAPLPAIIRMVEIKAEYTP
ncbi:MAG TPA: hypothetical protein VN155_17000 [Devosia sp.]|nr:hypothetical protein [Devosia sp.]